MEYTIEIDCPPGNPRPDDLFPGVLEGTGLLPEDFTLVSKFFGNWTWLLHEDKEKLYIAQRDIVKRRIVVLHDSGVIRYGSW